jgi:hypothetical protein
MKRIAVYIVGHFRNFNETWPQYATIFADSSDVTVDIFITFWDVRNTNDTSPVCEADVLKICPNAKNVQILSSREPLNTHGHSKNVAGQLYTLQEGVSIVPDSYDWYVRLRSDLYFFQTDILQQVLSSSDQVDLWIPEKVWYTEANYPARDVFNDYLWIGTRAITEYLAQTYAALPTIPHTYTEELLARRIRAYPSHLVIKHFACLFNLDRRTRGEDMFLQESRELTALRQQLIGAHT